MSSIQAVTALTISSALLVGTILALLGELKVLLADRPDLSGARLSRQLYLINLLLVPVVFACGYGVDSWGIRPFLIAGSVLLAVALFLFSAGGGSGWVVTGLVLGGTGLAALGVSTVVLMPRAFFGPQRMLGSLSMGLVFVGLGALLAPVVTGLLRRGIGFRRTMALWALLALVPAFLATLPASESIEYHGPRPGLTEVLAEPGVWLGGIVYMLYSPLEAAVTLWVTLHLADHKEGGRRAFKYLVLFWACFVGVRLVLALLAQAGYPEDRWYGLFLVIPCLLAAMVLGNLPGSAARGTAWTDMVALGVLLGPLFPVLLAMVFTTTPVRGGEGTAYGAVFAIGSLGGAVLSPVVGYGLRLPGALKAVMVPIALAFLLLGATLTFSLMAGR